MYALFLRFLPSLTFGSFARVLCLALAGLTTTAGAVKASAQATFTVTTLTDAAVANASNCSNRSAGGSLDAACSLRDALAAAAGVNGSAGTTPVTVNFAPALAAVGSPGTINLGTNALTLPTYTTVQGLTAGSGYSLVNLIFIQGSSHIAFVADSTVVHAALNNLTIANSAPALSNSGEVTVSQCTFMKNSTASGGAIFSGGTLTVLNSTFTGNSASLYGGAIYSSGTNTVGPVATAKNLTVSGSTFQGNSSATDGGAIYVGRASVGAIDSSTFTGNSASRDGAAIFTNNGSGLTRVTNSILNGDTGGSECAGVGCNGAVRAFVFAGGEPSGVYESGTITMTISLSTGQVFTIDGGYGYASTGGSLASLFGAYLSSGYGPTLSGQGFGPTLVVASQSGTITSVVFKSPSYFTITPVPDSVLSGTGNTVAVGSAAANLSVLGNHGGPTQTVLPLPGSAALCAITPTSPAGTDQRSLPRSTEFGTTLCQDSGAVQTNYGLAFAQQPNSTPVNTALAPPPSVQLSEGAHPLLQGNALITIKDLGGAISGMASSRTAANGIAAFPGISITKVQAADMLTASATVGAYNVSTTSNDFEVTPRPSASLAGSAVFPLTALSNASSRVFTLTNTGTVTANITALAVSSAPEFTQTNTCGLTLAGGASCAITVTFRPVVEGSRSGLLTLVSDATGYTQTIALTGSAAYAAATLTGSAGFPGTTVGSSATAQSFTLANVGAVSLAVNGISVTGDFSQTNGCGVSLAAGTSCTISVVFAPTATGTRTGTLAISSNANTATTSVALSGTGTAAPSFTVSDNSTGASSTGITVTAGGTGTGTLKLVSTNGFVGSVVLICAAQTTAPAGATCTVTSPVALVAGAAAIAAVTVTTTSRTQAAGFSVLPNRGWPALFTLLGLISTTLPILRAMCHGRRAAGLLVLLLVLGFGVIGCGAGGTAPATVANPNGTPAGTYTYTVTATGNGTTVTQAIAVTIQ